MALLTVTVGPGQFDNEVSVRGVMFNSAVEFWAFVSKEYIIDNKLLVKILEENDLVKLPVDTFGNDSIIAVSKEIVIRQTV